MGLVVRTTPPPNHVNPSIKEIARRRRSPPGFRACEHGQNVNSLRALGFLITYGILSQPPPPLLKPHATTTAATNTTAHAAACTLPAPAIYRHPWCVGMAWLAVVYTWGRCSLSGFVFGNKL
jgi:hypothetical protein